MAKFSKIIIQDLLNKSDTASSSDEKGKIFEDLVIYLFTKCHGLRLVDRNIHDTTGSREFDVALGNNRSRSQFDYLDPIIICECKNESTPIGSDNIRDFHQKLRTCGANNGIIVSSKGISGQTQGKQQYASSAIIDAMTMDKIKIIVLTRAEILEINTTDDLSNLIWQKFSQLTLRRATG